MDLLNFIYNTDFLLKSHKVLRDLIRIYPKLLDGKKTPEYDLEEIQDTMEELIFAYFKLKLPFQAIINLLTDALTKQTLNEEAFDKIYDGILAAEESMINRLVGQFILKRNIERHITVFLQEYKEFIKLGYDNVKLLLRNDKQRNVWLEKNKPIIKEFIRQLIRNNKGPYDEELKKRKYETLNDVVTSVSIGPTYIKRDRLNFDQEAMK